MLGSISICTSIHPIVIHLVNLHINILTDKISTLLQLKWRDNANECKNYIWFSLHIVFCKMKLTQMDICMMKLGK